MTRKWLELLNVVLITLFSQCLVVEEMTRVSPSICASYLAQSNLCINNINQV